MGGRGVLLALTVRNSVGGTILSTVFPLPLYLNICILHRSLIYNYEGPHFIHPSFPYYYTLNMHSPHSSLIHDYRERHSTRLSFPCR
jgi:hypothetical protein